MGAKGENHGDVAQRLRAQGRASLGRRLRFVFAAYEFGHGRRAKTRGLHHRSQRSDSIRGMQRRRARTAKLRQSESETGRTEMTSRALRCHSERSEGPHNRSLEIGRAHV